MLVCLMVPILSWRKSILAGHMDHFKMHARSIRPQIWCPFSPTRMEIPSRRLKGAGRLGPYVKGTTNPWARREQGQWLAQNAFLTGKRKGSLARDQRHLPALRPTEDLVSIFLRAAAMSCFLASISGPRHLPRTSLSVRHMAGTLRFTVFVGFVAAPALPFLKIGGVSAHLLLALVRINCPFTPTRMEL